MTRITSDARRQIIAKMDGKRATHRRLYAAGYHGQPAIMDHKADLVDVLASMGFEVEAMSHAQIDGLMVEWDNLEAREASNARIGLPDRRVAMAPTDRKVA